MAVNNLIAVGIDPRGSSLHQECYLCGNTISPNTKIREIRKIVTDKKTDEALAVCNKCDNTLSGTYLGLLYKKYPQIIGTIQSYWNKYLTKTPLEWQK